MVRKKITLKEIREYLEQKSGIEDISLNTRARDVADLKKSYCKLARIFTSSSLDDIGKVLRIDYTHDKVLYSLKKFDEVYPTNGLRYSNVFDEAYAYFSKINGISSAQFGDSETEKAYSKKMSKVVNSFMIEIERRDEKIRLLQQQNKKLKRKIEFFNKQILNKV